MVVVVLRSGRSPLRTASLDRLANLDFLVVIVFYFLHRRLQLHSLLFEQPHWASKTMEEEEVTRQA